MGYALRTFLDGQKAEATREAYAADLRQFLGRDAGSMTNRELAHVTSADVLQWYRRIDRRFKTATVVRKLATVRSAFGHLVRAGIVPKNPADVATVKPPTTPIVTSTRGLTEGEAGRLLDSVTRSGAAGLRDYAILLLLLHNGLRRGEISALRRSDLKREVDGTTVALVRRSRRVRAVKLKVEVVDAIRAYHDAEGEGADECVFRGHSNRRSAMPGMTPKAVWLVVRRCAERVGLGRRISPNSLRLTHITMALQHGCPIGRVQAAVGHVRPETTMRYARLLDGGGDHATDFVTFRRRK